MSESATPLLFESNHPAIQVSEPEPGPNEKLAAQFIAWCCSFGDGFSNSPDIPNLRYWTKKMKLNVKGADESNLLIEARRQYQRRLTRSVTLAN